ncbi:Maf family protein [Chitinilyticum piscinae]|uniref:dTTP/UTP pyrophosphatase n=1 Tax=Chitinilyticum piscinae TaxID=2866724 RepID=A0A8J7K7G9_9NEIS|nr:septum formation inhibitor Maf [Chitinilyticum piscinae]
MTDIQLYLASGSPRRRELLAQLGVRFAVIRADIDETPLPDETVEAYVLRLAREKALAGWRAAGEPALPVLGADTTVAHDGRILGKPADAADAAAMLRDLSGSTHAVLTAVAVCAGGEVEVTLSASSVRFMPLGEAQIAAYVASGEPLDKAGAYGIQGWGGLFVSDLSGSFTGVMGLPVHETALLLARYGLGHLAEA